jgi:hypothetical protein
MKKKEELLMYSSCRFLSIFFVLVFTCVAMGDVVADLTPPEWRGDDGSVWASWDFETSETSPAPDMGSNPYGDTILTASPGTGQEWQATLDGAVGVWPLSGNIIIEVDNRPELQPEKLVWIQLTWQRQAPENLPPLVWVAYDSSSTGFLDPEVEFQRTEAGMENWTYSLYKVTLDYNPTHETINIQGGVNVDSVVIDTLCIPEPATVGFLGLGALALYRRRKR